MSYLHRGAARACLCLGLLIGAGLGSVQVLAGVPATASSQAAAPTPAPVGSAPAPFASAHAGDFRVASAPDAWGGPRTAADATLSDQVTSYTIHAMLDPDKHTVQATEHMTWRNRSQRPVDKVYFHLYLNAFQNPGSTFFTERRKFSGSGHSRGGAELEKGEWGFIELKKVEQNGQKVSWRYVQPDGGPATDQTVVEFDLPQAIPPGGTLELDIAFHDQLPKVVERTGWHGKFHLVAQWFPKIGVLELPGERGATEVRWNVHEFHYHSEFYADYGNYDVTLTVPKNYTVGAVGEQQGEPVIKGDQATWHFKQTDVEDFAWVAAPDYGVQTTTWTGPGSPKVKVKVIYPPEFHGAAAPILDATKNSLTYFSDTLGPYPYKTVTAVVPPYHAGEAGGMEYPTFFTAESSTGVEPGTIAEYMLYFVTIHEFGHGYFMGLLGSNEFEEPFLDEGMNRYWDNRMWASLHGGVVHATTPLLRWLGIDPAIDVRVPGRLAGVLGIGFPADPLDENSWDRMSNQSYGSVYMRTESTMNTIENLVGAEAMGRAMKLYYQRWHFRHPNAADLRDALAEGTGKPKLIHQIFASQVFGTERVDDRVVDINSVSLAPRPGSYVTDGKRHTVTAAELDKAASSKLPDMWRSFVTVKRDGAAIPTTLKVTFSDGSTATTAWDDGSVWKRFHWDRPVKIVSAELDPGHKILLDANLLNNSHAVKANAAASRRWAADFAALVESLLTLGGNTMSGKNKRVGWGALPGSLVAALQWRVWLVWLVFMALPTAIMALPFGHALGKLLDHSVHSAALAVSSNGLVLGDAFVLFGKHSAWFSGSQATAMMVTLLLTPFLTGVVITAVKGMRQPRLGELMHGGLAYYWRMLRLMLWSLVPYVVAFVISSIIFGLASVQASNAVLESTADTGYLIARIVAVMVFVLAHAFMESGRAQFGADENLRSATRAFGRGISMLARRPLATLGLYLGTSIIGYVLAGLVAMARIRTDAVGIGGWLAALALAQLIVLVLAWQRTARLGALVRLARVTSFGGRAPAATRALA